MGERVFGKVMREFGYEPAQTGLVIPSPVELARILAILPGRLFNMLFRSTKPFRMAKLKRHMDVLERVLEGLPYLR